MTNVKLTSNVYIRDTDKYLVEDVCFLRQVRGVSAVRKMLWRAFELDDGTSPDHPRIRNLLGRGIITETQMNSLKWGIYCLNCGRIPVGETFAGSPEFRCSRPGCR